MTRQFDSTAVKQFAAMFPHYQLKAHEVRNTVVFTSKDGVDYSLEELVAMILEYAVQLAARYAGL